MFGLFKKNMEDPGPPKPPEEFTTTGVVLRKATYGQSRYLALAIAYRKDGANLVWSCRFGPYDYPSLYLLREKDLVKFSWVKEANSDTWAIKSVEPWYANSEIDEALKELPAEDNHEAALVRPAQ